MKNVRYTLEYKATYQAEMGVPDEIAPEKELQYIQENLMQKQAETGHVPIDFDNPPMISTIRPLQVMDAEKSNTLPAKDRLRYLNRLQEVNDLLATANIEWYPKQTEVFELEREKEDLEATLQYDDYAMAEDMENDFERE
ncbi:MAG: hypothetical protein IKM88_04900 [Lachnospiraceae bacterium]|nr:hypothetical protein [Lachnospiraceae bacterium]MBR6849556.1 hypothetical protein [Lachnospiraceae bacterium]